MDITNGKNSSCLIELVINSQKKNEVDWTPQEYFDEVFTSVQYQQNQTRNPNVAVGALQSAPGGWQAFYDPEYPLLHVKSAHSKKVKSMVNEVHRSSHMLAPGQTKKISISLGSLYYNLGNKCDTAGLIDPQAPDFGAGSLLVCLGHSGVSQLSMPTANTSYSYAHDFTVKPDTESGGTHTVVGAGFWVGKQKAPSEIVVKGRYEEKYYPSYMVSDQRNQYDDTIMMPPSIWASNVSGEKSLVTLPSGLPVQETIGTVDATHQAVATKVSSAEKRTIQLGPWILFYVVL